MTDTVLHILIQGSSKISYVFDKRFLVISI